MWTRVCGYVLIFVGACVSMVTFRNLNEYNLCLWSRSFLSAECVFVYTHVLKC